MFWFIIWHKVGCAQINMLEQGFSVKASLSWDNLIVNADLFLPNQMCIFHFVMEWGSSWGICQFRPFPPQPNVRPSLCHAARFVMRHLSIQTFSSPTKCASFTLSCSKVRHEAFVNSDLFLPNQMCVFPLLHYLRRRKCQHAHWQSYFSWNLSNSFLSSFHIGVLKWVCVSL